jgi:transposase
MKFIIGQNRNQIPLFAFSIDQAIAQDNEVRLIDMFVDSLKLADFGFRAHFIENGRPAYRPSDLLKLFIYGYLNRIRSSRALEKECVRNIELMWLLNNLVPDHNTISNFRRDNPKAIRRVFRATVQLAKHFDLIGGKLIAGDSTKLRAQNSKKNNFNQGKIEKHIAYIDAKLDEYNKILASEDKDSVSETQNTEIEAKVQIHRARKARYEQFQRQLEQTGETQISTSDPESRQLITRNNITEVAYNVQTTVDAKHNIPIDFKVTNQNDSKAMGGMVRRAKTILQNNDFTAIYDKGYHTGSEFDYANKHGVEVMVAIPEVASHAPDPAFDVEHFHYDKTNDTYTCPENKILTTNGTWYNKSRGKSFNKVKHYKASECAGCPFSAQCTTNKKGRFIERSEHADLIYANKVRIEQNKEMYRQRQAIVEHPYGIIKRQWDFYYIMTKKSIKRASSDVGLIFVAYNLRRIMNLIDQEKLKAYLNSLFLAFNSLTTNYKPMYRIRFFYLPKLFLKITTFISKHFFTFRADYSLKISFTGGF